MRELAGFLLGYLCGTLTVALLALLYVQLGRRRRRREWERLVQMDRCHCICGCRVPIAKGARLCAHCAGEGYHEQHVKADGRRR